MPVTVVNPVQNRDEPARNPYQELRLSGKGSGGVAAVSFSLVPTGTRRVIIHINCIALVKAGEAVNLVEVSSAVHGFDTAVTEYLPTIGTPVTSFSQLQTVYGDDPQLYIDAGDAPQISAFASDLNPVLDCRVAGYDVKL